LWFKWAEPAQPWIALPLVLTVEEIALFKLCTKITVGNGAKTSVWKDRWLNVKAPQDIAPDCFKLAWRKNQTVVAALPTRRWMRGLRRISSEHEHELRKFIELWTQLSQFQMTDEEDTITWRFSPNGCYSAKSAYMVQFIGAVTDRRWKLIWKAKVELKCRFFVWLLLQFRLPTASLPNDSARTSSKPNLLPLPHNGGVTLPHDCYLYLRQGGLATSSNMAIQIQLPTQRATTMRRWSKLATETGAANQAQQLQVVI
jgi:hypothetical protein